MKSFYFNLDSHMRVLGHQWVFTFLRTSNLAHLYSVSCQWENINHTVISVAYITLSCFCLCFISGKHFFVLRKSWIRINIVNLCKTLPQLNWRAFVKHTRSLHCLLFLLTVYKWMTFHSICDFQNDFKDVISWSLPQKTDHGYI